MEETQITMEPQELELEVEQALAEGEAEAEGKGETPMPAAGGGEAGAGAGDCVIEVEGHAASAELDRKPCTSQSVVCELGEDEVVILTKSDKAVCTNDTLEDLQRALTYEAVFSSLIEKKVMAIKRDCEERKRAKRMKRKSIGRIFLPKKFFGGGGGGSSLRKSSCYRGAESEPESLTGTSMQDVGQLSRTALKMAARKRYSEDIERISGTTCFASPDPLSPAPCPYPLPANIETPATAEESISSTLSTSSGQQDIMAAATGPALATAAIASSTGADVANRRSLLVRAQTHMPAELAATSSSSPSSVPTPTPTPTPTATATATSNGAGQASSMLERSFDAVSLASGYENGLGARGLHSSTMADESLTSIRDSVESLSFASSSRCTVSFGGTEIIPQPEETASLLYERARLAKRMRILEAKSISAQCSPILPRHLDPVLTPPPSAATTAQHPQRLAIPSKFYLQAQASLQSQAPAQAQKPSEPQTEAPTQWPAARSSSALGAGAGRLRLLTKQQSATESFGRNLARQPDLRSAYGNRCFSRQNTSEDSANVTLSTLLNQSDSMSLHVASMRGESPTMAQQGFPLPDRFKSKSASQLMDGPALLPAKSCPNADEREIVSGTRAELLRPDTLNMSPTSNIRLSEKRIQVGMGVGVGEGMPAIACTASSSFPVITTTTSAASNGAIVVADTAKLNRMTSTSTGSSVAQTGCCAGATNRAASRDREKQRVKSSWPSGQSGSDDEYRQRKRKYKRHHRCSDPVLVYPSPSGLPHCILSVPPNDPVQFSYNEDYVYDMQLQLESDKNDDLEEIVPHDDNRHRHRKHRRHRHKKRRRHKKPKILVQDLETQVVKVMDPDDLPKRARWTIIATACLLLLMCLMLVGITLRMAPIIDDMVRQENERLMKETMERARFGKNFTDTSSLIASPAQMHSQLQQIP